MGGSVETLRNIRHLAVWNVDVTDGFCVWVLAETADDQSVPRVEVLLVGLEIVQELDSLVLDGDLVGEGCVVGEDQVELGI